MFQKAHVEFYIIAEGVEREDQLAIKPQITISVNTQKLSARHAS